MIQNKAGYWHFTEDEQREMIKEIEKEQLEKSISYKNILENLANIKNSKLAKASSDILKLCENEDIADIEYEKVLETIKGCDKLHYRLYEVVMKIRDVF